MSQKGIRSTSTNTRIKLPAKLSDSSSLLSVNKSFVVSSSNSLERSEEKPLKIKLPRIPVSSSRDSGQDTSATIETSEDSIATLKKSLQNEWEKRSIPSELQNSFNKSVWSLPRHKAVQIVSREIEDLKHNRSSLQNAIRAVVAREESLLSIYEMNNCLKSVTNWEKMKEVQLECAELLHAHRILTINAVESIEKWREMIIFSSLINNEAKFMHIPFIWKNENYLTKVKNDLDFLTNSEFSKVFNFEINDPLLIKPSKVLIKIKEKKIDHNYFIQHGQVVVSLPSSLKGKIDYVEEILGKEAKFESRLNPQQINDISNVIYEELCEEEVENDVNNFLLDQRPEIAEGVFEKMLDDELNSIFKEIVQDSQQNLAAEIDKNAVPNITDQMIEAEINKMLESLVKEQLKNVEKEKKENIVKEQRIKEENSNIARLIYNDLFSGVIQLMLEDTISEITESNKERDKKIQKAKQEKENTELAEKIQKECIETIINEFTAELSEEIERDQLNKKVTNKIYDDLLMSLFTELVSENYSSIKIDSENKKNAQNMNIAEKIYEGLFDSLLIDLPQICKESYDECHELYSDKGELLENMGFQFASESGFDNFSGLVFKKINAPESVFMNLIEEYYNKIPGPEMQVTAEVEKLEEVTEGIDAKWFWALINNNIVGLLVFSIDIDRNDVRVINIHHLTCLDWNFYDNIIEAASDFIWNSDNCQEIRINLHVDGPTEIPINIKKVFNNQKFRWKTNVVDENDNCSVIVMGKMRAMKMKAPQNKKKLLPKRK